jgi:hypothetical protein
VLGLVVSGGVLSGAQAQGAVLPVFDVSERLIEEGVAPAALVPTYVPPLIAGRGGFIQPGFAKGRVYSMRILHQPPSGTDGVIALQRCAPIGRAAFGTCAGLAATRRDFVRQGFRFVATRVRARNGFLLTRKAPGGPERWLIWREDGLVYSIGSGTPKKVPLGQLRTTAARLDRLQHRYLGTSPDPDSSTGAVLVAGESFVAGHVDWEAACAGGSIRAGAADLALARRQGDAFGLDIALAGSPSALGWTGSISGVVSPAAIVLDIRATGVFDGASCDTGALSLTLPRFDTGI